MVEICLVLASDINSFLIHANRGYLVGLVFSSHFAHWAPYSDTHHVMIHASASANALLFIDGAPSIRKGLWLRVCRISFPGTCSLTFPRAFSAVCYTSDFVLTPYELKQWPGLKIPTLLVTCAMLMTYKMSSMSFSTATIHTWSLSIGRTRLCFLPQFSTTCLLFRARTKVSFQNKSFLPSCANCFEQASSRTP